MKIGIIGYRNHSKKLLDLCKPIKEISEIIIFCYKNDISKKLNHNNKNKKISFTSNLQKLERIKAVFISSPNKTHIKYTKFFLKKNIYIFCEKPACTNLKDFNFLVSLSNKLKNKIYFNHNFQVSSIKKKLEKIIFKKQNGKTNYVSINISHGISFNKNKFKNWRKKQNNIFDNIIGNLGIHYLELIISLYGKINNINFLYKKNSNKNSLDTGFVFIEFKKNIIVNMYFSYAGAYEQNMNFYLTNSTVKVANNKIDFFYPRDTFDKNGKYCYPKKKTFLLPKDIQNNNLLSSIKFFLNYVKNDKNIEIKYFNQALYVTKILLNNNSNFKKYNIFDYK